MKRGKRSRKSDGYPHLVGNSGKFCWDKRLHSLKMGKRYKKLLQAAEYDRKSKISQMLRVTEQYWELCDLWLSLKRANENNSNFALIMELQEKKLEVRKNLIYLESKIDFPLPEILDKAMQKIFNRNNKPRRRKLTSSFDKITVHAVNRASSNETEVDQAIPTNTDENRLQAITPHSFATFKNVSELAPHWSNRSSRRGIVKSQIFVRTDNLQMIAINIDLFSTGNDLVDELTEELGEEVKKYNIIFGAKELDMNKTLFEQQVYHGTTVDLNIRLLGGKGKKSRKKQPQVKEKDPNMNNPETENPESWNKQQVREWVLKMCHQLQIEAHEVSFLKEKNGTALESLTKEDWIRRSANHGDILFNQWQKLKERHVTKKQEENDAITDVKSVNIESMKEQGSKKDHESKTSQNMVAEIDDTFSATPAGKFGKVQNLEEIGNLMYLENFSNDGITPIPEFGSVVSVTGICAGTQSRLDNVATLFIRDEPPGASNVFHKMEVAIRSNKTSINLQRYNVETLLKEIRTDMYVAVKGRVERLGQDNDFHEPHCEMIRFKLVVDSDNHSLVYVKRQRPMYTRQHSQPWWIQGTGAESSANWNLKVGDRIDKNLQIVFCESTVSDDEIMNYVVAFKNCYDGEILVGVKMDNDKNGVVTGRKFSEGEMAKWREKLSMAIAKILPESNEGAAICCDVDEACNLVHEKKCFVCVLNLSESGKNEASGNYIAWIHVPQGGTARVYFKKPSDVHAFIRKGAENKRMMNYEELFSSLSSLGSRRKPREILDEDLNIEEKFKEAVGKTGLQKKYKVLEPVPRYENQENELKMVFGSDPTKTIIDKYLKEYTCGFLNASGGTILFGVQEAEKSKCGHIVGLVIPIEKRRELLREAVTTFSKFYPPVSESQFRLIFHKIIVPSESIVKNDQSDKDNSCKYVLLRGPSEEISKKWPKFVKDKLNDCLCRVVPVQPECFCIVVENQDDIPESEFVNNLNDFTKQNSKIRSDSIESSDLKTFLKHLCMIELKIFPSQYPIHLIKPIDTHVFDKQGNLIKLSIQKMMSKFELGFDSRIRFDVDKFLNHVETFDLSGHSYILITSPFELSTTERDLHGLVSLQWTLVIDFDQHPKQEGHLFHRFVELNVHLLEREPFIKTPQDNKLGLNPEHSICWLAARGYHEVGKTLSKPDHGNWNMTHRDPLRTLLKAELTSCVKPNYLHIVVLWDDGHQLLVKSLQTILEDILSINGRLTAVTFVCSTPEARSDIVEYLVQPLQQDYWKIITADSVYVAPPYVLSRHLSYELPTPYQSEDDYQVPHKKVYRGKDQTFPDILPQKVRHNISSYLKMMYMKKEKRLNERTLENERKKFYSGAAITDLGLRRKFGIVREKMEELEKEFKNLSNDKRSHVSMLCLKVDRGAGSTTLCLQFLYKHHKEYPCAQLLQIGDKLLSCIRDINYTTKLPLLLFVDDEISHPQEFLDFTKELVGCRNVNVILLLIEPAEASGRKVPPQQETKRATRMKSIVDSSTLRTCPYKVVELRRELRDKEMEVLANHLENIKTDEKTSEKLKKLMNKSKLDWTVRTFAHFGLTAFGQDFLGLKQFVEFRLRIASDKQRKVLSFLSLIHIYTDSLLPASALSGFLESSNAVNLEEEFQDDYLRELLSPPLDRKDSRRISFLEVAEEILKQLASAKSGGYDKVKYWNFIKDVSVDLAKHVLSVNISTRSIDRLTRRLFVTSEYESKKFSALIRAMKNANLDIARNTLIGLEEVFEKHSSFQAHIRAHLAKYYMIVAKPKNFEEAMPLIEKAIKDQPDDSLLRHIHGDIIRLHVRDLKEKPVNDCFNMDTIVWYAIKSSDSFEFVRRKRPHDSHGYMSDAIVRITVMEAGEKKQSKKLRDEDKSGKASFVDYLVDTLDEIGKRGDRIITEERYLLSLIPDAHQFLYDGVSDDFERKEEWKQNFRECIGPISNLRRLCDKIRQLKPVFHDFRDDSSIWLHGALLSIQSLNNGFEIDNEDLTLEQIEDRIKEIEDCALGLKCPEPLMKFWIRYSRCRKNVPLLKDVKKRVKDWVLSATKQNRTSSSAEFYNYVVNVLEALQDPDDRKKREKVTKLQHGKNYKKDNVAVVPLEWLNPREGHHNSIDMLLQHDDLVKEHKGPSGREVIEGYLSKKRIKRWKGTVSEVNEQKLFVGTITFKRYFEVRFMPQSVTTGRPKQGQTVSFCLGFDRLGLSAWWVRGEEGTQPLENVKTYKVCDDEDVSSDNEEDLNSEISTSTSLFGSSFTPQRDRSWDSHNGYHMQGVVVSTNPKRGFGSIRHPDVPGPLFFHASQLAKPVITLEGTIEKPMVLEFKVEKQSDDKTRATDIHVVKAEDILPSIAEFRKAIEKESSPTTGRRQKEPSTVAKSRTDTQAKETGVVVRHSKDKSFGFIKPDKKSLGKDVFFHLRCLLVKGSLPDIGQRVEFTVVIVDKGLEAHGVCAVPESVSKRRAVPAKSWGQLVGFGIQEGFVESVSDDQGYIISKNALGPKGRLLFYHKDVQNRHTQNITENCKVHLQVGKRGGKLIAVNINIIGTP